MARGIATFNGARLEEARLARGLTQTSLAQMVGRDSSTVSAWETGRQNPDWDAVSKLCAALSVRATLFSQAGSCPEQHFFRSNASITIGLQKKSKSRLRWAELLKEFLSEWVDFARVDFPALDMGDLGQIDDAGIESAAAACREHWGLGFGPIADMVAVLENAGAIVVREELGGAKMDGVSAWSIDCRRPFVLLSADKASAARSRFDAAHELGHLVMHQGIQPLSLNRAQYAELESQAHKFASAFLLPAESFAKDLYSLDLDHFVSLKRKWRVSVAGMIMRAAALGVVEPEYKARLFKYLSARGWRKAEPLDDDLKPELPVALAEAVKICIEGKVLTREEILDGVGLEPGDLELLASLPRGYLRQEAAPVVRLKPVP
ncbi:XRE family transcriptional regulator [Brevundimonas sp.]|uniref:helix-turn-helix domain-containing protein n=1 Tax=Brevundimonas sp. TaxID=1871086 RepID=UPI002E136E45|nr:XRE family transcriptional regulator [Brevundimonas sp.]